MQKKTFQQIPVLLSEELSEVHKRLLTVAADLKPPLSDLVANQIEFAQPPIRAAVALAAGLNALEIDEVYEQRINLGTALELLYIALAIHKNLIGAEGINSQQEIDKTWVGTIILAGDYCFSRSAEFAARTGEPEVVAIFAKALKDISEGHLRAIHENGLSQYNENVELCVAGCQAAAHLAGLPDDLKAETVQYCENLLTWYNRQWTEVIDTGPGFLLADLIRGIDKLLPAQQPRWQQLTDWIS